MFANGRTHLAIPGPSVTPDEVLRAMHRTSTDIYGGALLDMTVSIYPDLQKLARTASALPVIYLGNGHAAWEGAIANTLARGDRVLVLATGNFGIGWANQARAMGAEVVVVDFGLTTGIDLSRTEEALRADLASGTPYKAVLMSHVDTATSLCNPVLPVRQVMDAVGHPGLLMVDCIASLGCDRFEMDAWGVDVMVATSQKGLMVPPGISFVYFGAKALAAREGVGFVPAYWDLKPRANPPAFYGLFGGTPPVQHLYGLRAALDMIMAEGLENVWARHAGLAQAVWAAFDAWSAGGPVSLCLSDPSLRSHAVTAAYAGPGNGDALRGWVTKFTGVTLGVSLGRDPAADYFRVGHMGHVNAHDVFGVLGAMDAGLKALDIPHGEGALAAATKVIAAAAKKAA
ncbi:pyridoxal-phosphate-dependent aminotransferase family protein [Ketogulonicigenium vulgare]|uniref:Aminotransferase, class V n=1 Tax=Ketogulonicigenium vulgare (strain WSH-001) TaxID=759362 RepID=F9Y3H6_KETVW|nr:aminotransferase class V-fold PLP-dependent enzyme [Ketogulonicigenium vulgare]ADO43307.1 elongation factor P [Ketogulonicigenium vulgare Y25]AEM41596.1 Aminotransferase, class V [Ketogulonicigenium vulgare WSH-001]ALJ81713.1 septum site-determining protein [Ketogulonicigenium vulgare]ANW34378.1 septum site-determining protein [Ketogulonicigenium vulgare]AOZ55345.1 elongation factor P [Ketogulonicigenium vulgare]